MTDVCYLKSLSRCIAEANRNPIQLARSLLIPRWARTMKTLIDGFLRFKHQIYPERSRIFHQLATGQKPEALFITCSDSRVVPNLITQTEPGQIFVCRTVGNQVPAAGTTID